MTAYYNENDAYVAQWLRNLISEGHIAPGHVDERSIVDVRPADLAGYAQCHFFAGIGGWSRALRLAGWSDDTHVWTGSCPCQPYSSAARGRNKAIDLWPAWRPLIIACRPDIVFGEQVDEARAWLDVICDDMGTAGYTIRAKVIPAYCVGEDHVRERIYFAGYANGYSQSGRAINAEASRMPRPRGLSKIVVPTNGVPNRVAAMRAFGNAIVPELAAAFIESVR